jgi:hypothetical protein
MDRTSYQPLDLPNSVLHLVDSRKTKTSQLWIAGCSIAHGIGLDLLGQRYGQLVSDHFNTPASFLTQGGTSIEWSADQILRSDIQSGDTVIWGITGVNRFVHWNDNGVMFSVTPGLFDPDNPHFIVGSSHIRNKTDMWKELMHDKSRLYHAIRQISQVIAFCKKINANLILGCHLELSLKEQSDSLEAFLLETEHYIHFPHKSKNWKFLWPTDYLQYLDKGNDNRHPGPLTHKQWADILIEYIKNKGYINEA